MAFAGSVQQIASGNVLLTIGNHVRRLNVTKDRFWGHRSRKALDLLVIRMVTPRSLQ